MTNALRQKRSKQSDANKDTIRTNVTKDRNGTFIGRFIVNWLIMDPTLLNIDDAKSLKNYEVQKHEQMRYIYLLGGRLRTVRKKPLQILTFSAILVAGILYWIFEAKWQWHNINPSVVILFTYFWLLSFTFFLKSATSDPGILPRNLHIPCSIHDSKLVVAPQEYFNSISLPYYNDTSHGVSIRYCPTCHIWRPPRASHCRVCNSCIANHDHHCIYINNCVGRRNYKYFLWFLLSSVISCIFLIVTAFIHVYHYRISSRSKESTFDESIAKYPVSFLLVIYGFISLVYPVLLLSFHIYLTSLNISTREYLNNVFLKGDVELITVYNTHSIFHNLFINWIGTPDAPSLLRPRDRYEEGDLRMERIEPLLSSPSS